VIAAPAGTYTVGPLLYRPARVGLTPSGLTPGSVLKCGLINHRDVMATYVSRAAAREPAMRVKNWNCRCQKLNLISIVPCTRQLTMGLVERHPAQSPMSFLIAVRAAAAGAPKGRQLGWWLVSQNDRCWRRPPTRKRASISQTPFWFHRP